MAPAMPATPAGWSHPPSGWTAWCWGNPSGVRERCGGCPRVSLVPRATPGYSRGIPPGFARGMPGTHGLAYGSDGHGWQWCYLAGRRPARSRLHELSQRLLAQAPVPTRGGTPRELAGGTPAVPWRKRTLAGGFPNRSRSLRPPPHVGGYVFTQAQGRPFLSGVSAAARQASATWARVSRKVSRRASGTLARTVVWSSWASSRSSANFALPAALRRMR